jgi:hypothetical protein
MVWWYHMVGYHSVPYHTVVVVWYVMVPLVVGYHTIPPYTVYHTIPLTPLPNPPANDSSPHREYQTHHVNISNQPWATVCSQRLHPLRIRYDTIRSLLTLPIMLLLRRRVENGHHSSIPPTHVSNAYVGIFAPFFATHCFVVLTFIIFPRRCIGILGTVEVVGRREYLYYPLGTTPSFSCGYPLQGTCGYYETCEGATRRTA